MIGITTIIRCWAHIIEIVLIANDDRFGRYSRTSLETNLARCCFYTESCYKQGEMKPKAISCCY